jgi:hypothetical protein
LSQKKLYGGAENSGIWVFQAGNVARCNCVMLAMSSTDNLVVNGARFGIMLCARKSG